jgi:hypothetical protein
MYKTTGLSMFPVRNGILLQLHIGQSDLGIGH